MVSFREISPNSRVAELSCGISIRTSDSVCAHSRHGGADAGEHASARGSCAFRSEVTTFRSLADSPDGLSRVRVDDSVPADASGCLTAIRIDDSLATDASRCFTAVRIDDSGGPDAASCLSGVRIHDASLNVTDNVPLCAGEQAGSSILLLTAPATEISIHLCRICALSSALLTTAIAAAHRGGCLAWAGRTNSVRGGRTTGSSGIPTSGSRERRSRRLPHFKLACSESKVDIVARQ